MKTSTFISTRLCVGVAMLWGILSPIVRGQEDTKAALDQAQGYFEADEVRKAVATLIEIAKKHPEDRMVGSLLYATIRNHVWHLPQALPVQHKGAVTALAFTADGSKLASGSSTGEVLLSSTQSAAGAPAAPETVVVPGESEVVGLAFSQDGKRLVVAKKADGLHVIDVPEKKVVYSSPKSPGKIVTFSAAQNADLVAIGCDQGTIQVVDLPGQKLVMNATPRVGEIIAVALSRSGKKIAAACGDRRARVWKTDTGELLGAGVVHPASLRAVDMSCDERYVLSAGESGAVWLSNPEEGVAVMPMIQCPGVVKSATISPDGSIIATTLDDCSVLFWDAFNGKQLQLNLREDGDFNAFLWANSSLRGATINEAGHASLWTLRDGTRRGETMPHDSPIVSAALTLDSKFLATGSKDGKARVWRTDGGAPLPTVRSHNARARSAFYSPDGKHLITTAEDHNALHWLSGSVNPAGVALKHRGRVVCGVFNADATRMLTCDDSGIAQFWDVATCKADGAPFVHEGPVNWVDFHPDGKRVATASGNVVKIWSVDDRAKPIAVIRHPSGAATEMKSARFSPNGKWIATGSTDGFARVWDAATYAEAGPPIDRGSPVLCARFSPDSTKLVVAGEDAHAVLYDTGTWKPFGVPVVTPGPVFSAAITEDNRFVVVASLLHDAVQFYEIATGRPFGQGLSLPAQPTCVDYQLQDKVVVVACDDGTVRSVDSPFVTQDVPPWMINFAEGLVGIRKTGPETFERVDGSFDNLGALLAKEAKDITQDFARLAEWKLTTGNQRHGMPRFASTLAANIERRVEDRSVDALFECYEAVSADPRVLAALSLFLPNARQGEFIADLVLGMENVDALSRCYAAGTLIRSGRSTEAEAVMAKALADAPEDPKVVRRVAKLHARLQKKDSAIPLFEKAARLDPTSAETARAYGWALYNFHQPKEAAVQFRRAQEIAGDMNDDLIAGLCLCAAAQNDLPEAKAQFQRLVTLDPSWKEAGHIAALPGWSQMELTQLENIRRGLFAGN